MIPFRCISASSTVRSALMGTGRLWVNTGLRVRHTSNWLFIPMSKRWRSKLSLSSTMMDSRFSRSWPVIIESSHLNIENVFVLDFLSSLGPSCSSFCSSPNSVRMRY